MSNNLLMVHKTEQNNKLTSTGTVNLLHCLSPRTSGHCISKESVYLFVCLINPIEESERI